MFYGEGSSMVTRKFDYDKEVVSWKRKFYDDKNLYFERRKLDYEKEVVLWERKFYDEKKV